MRYHLTPIRMAITNKSTNNQCWRECGEKGTLTRCWWECKLVQPLWRTVWRDLRKLNIELPYDPESHSWTYIYKLIFVKQNIKNHRSFYLAMENSNWNIWPHISGILDEKHLVKLLTWVLLRKEKTLFLEKFRDCL